MKRNRNKKLIVFRYFIQFIITAVISLYLSGIFVQLFNTMGRYDIEKQGTSPDIIFKPGNDLYKIIFTKPSLFLAAGLFIAFNILIYILGKRIKFFRGVSDKERNFEYSEKGTYGTSAWMSKKEKLNVLNTFGTATQTDETIIGKDEKNNVVTVPRGLS